MPIRERLHILLVDDNQDILNVEAAMLKEAGYDPILAKDGREALKVLFGKESSPKFSCVLLDLNMPYCNGLEVAKEIKRNYSPNIPVIAVSAHLDSEKYTPEIFQEVGIIHWIKKPFKVEQLVSVVDTYVRGH